MTSTPRGGPLLRKSHALIGVAAALAVTVAVIVVDGCASSGQGSSVVPSTTMPTVPPSLPAVGAATGSPASTNSGATVQQTIAHLEKALAKQPGDVKTELALANAYLLSQRYDQAALLFSEVLATNPENRIAPVRLALVWHAQGNDQKAISRIASVLRKWPNDQEAHYTLATIYFSQQRTEDARAEWQRAAEIDPTTRIGRTAENFVDLLSDRTPTPQPSD
jgi:cytochrome c-type biogenesis protein CcmH/NrfG